MKGARGSNAHARAESAVERVDAVARALTSTADGVPELQREVVLHRGVDRRRRGVGGDGAARGRAADGRGRRPAPPRARRRSTGGRRIRRCSPGSASEPGGARPGIVAGAADVLPGRACRGARGDVAVGRATADGDVEDVLAILASNAAIAMENARLYEQEKETVRRLRELDTMKTDFLSTVQHEMRTPLTAIWGSATSSRCAGRSGRTHPSSTRCAISRSPPTTSTASSRRSSISPWATARRWCWRWPTFPWRMRFAAAHRHGRRAPQGRIAGACRGRRGSRGHAVGGSRSPRSGAARAHRQRREIQRRPRERGGAGHARRSGHRAASRSSIRGSAFRMAMCLMSSSASSRWTTPRPGVSAAPAWASRSSNAWSTRTVRRSMWIPAWAPGRASAALAGTRGGTPRTARPGLDRLPRAGTMTAVALGGALAVPCTRNPL